MNDKKRKFWIRLIAIILVAAMVASSVYLVLALLLA